MSRPCPRCGTPVPEQARFCGQCGFVLTPAEDAPRAKTAMLGATMVDDKPFGAQPESQVPTVKPELGKTMADPEVEARARAIRDQLFGSAPTAAQAPIEAPKPALGKTMVLGSSAAAPPPSAAPAPTPAPRADVSPLSQSVMAPSTFPPPAPHAPAPAPIPPAPIAPAIPPAAIAQKTMLGMPAVELPKAAPAPAAPPPPQNTMLGVAIPGIAPTAAGPAAPPPAAAGPMHLPSKQGTMLGVAVPGIAPSHAAPEPQRRGMEPPRSHAPYAPSPPPPPIVPAPPPLVEEPLPAEPAKRAKSGVPALAVVGMLIAVVAVLGGVGAFFALRGGGPLTATPQLDESGKESLKIGCPSCPDGTTVSLGASSAPVKEANAVLPLPAPLSIGDNDLTVHIDRPAAGRDEDVKIHVPVAYRVRADVTTLTAKPPAITVRVEATPGTTVEVDGKPLALDAGGRGAYAIDLGKETDGPSDEQKVFERKIPFTITPKGGQPEKGELGARTAIVPLHLDAPGLLLVTDKPTAPVSGQTRAGATVTVDGATAPVDDKGRFGVRIELAQPGDRTLELVAGSPPLAPRTLHAKITRVASLDAAAKDLAGEYTLAYDAYAAEPASKIGQKAFVEGEVVEIRAAQGHSVLLVDDKKACAKGATCLVRVDHGEEDKIARGDSVRAYGKITGAVTSGGKSIPALDAALLVPGKAGSK